MNNKLNSSTTFNQQRQVWNSYSPPQSQVSECRVAVVVVAADADVVVVIVVAIRQNLERLD